MYFYYFSSKRFNKISKKFDYFRNACFSEFVFPENLKYRGFLISLVYEYSKFLFFKYLTDINTIKGVCCRNLYCVNRVFKHILIVEWGYIEPNFLNINQYNHFLPNFRNPSWYREDPLVDYSISWYDLFAPLHKTSPWRYSFIETFKKISPKQRSQFFFNFYLIMPVQISGYFTNTENFDFEPPPPPILINYPIVFELILLKFVFLSFFLSTSPSKIYLYYNGEFFASILLHIRNILFIILNRIKDKYFIKKEYVNSFQAKVTRINFSFLFLKSFYSRQTFGFLIVNFLLHYSRKENNLSFNIFFSRFRSLFYLCLSLIMITLIFFLFIWYWYRFSV